MTRHIPVPSGTALLISLVIVVVGIPAAPAVHAGEKSTAPWPEITEEERALKSIAQDPEADGVILRHTRDGKILLEKGYYVNVLDYHWRLKVLNERGKRYAQVHIPTYKYSRVEGIEARSIKPDGTILPVAADQIFEKLVQKGRGYKVTEKVFSFPAVEPGVILEYRYKRHRQGLFGLIYIEPWDFAGPEVTLLSRVTQAQPGTAGYRVLCNQCPNPDPQSELWQEGKIRGRRLTFELKNVPAYREELMMPPEAVVSPRMEMVLVKWINVSWEQLARMDELFTDWNAVAAYARYYYQKVYNLDEVLMKRTVAAWIQGVSDPKDRIKTVFRHVQEDFRYAPDDFVYGDVSSIASMLKARTADNEEKGLLLMAALKSIGVQANLALVVGKHKGKLQTDYPSLSQFSHVIVGVPQPDGSALWLDPTVTYAPFGFVPWQDSGVGALYITDRTSVLINLPRKEEINGTRYAITAKPVAGGRTALDIVAEFEGEDAIAMRQELVPAAEGARTSYLEEWLSEARPGAVLRSREFENLEDLEKPLRIKMAAEAPGLVTRADDLMLVRACILGCEEVNPLSKRERLFPFYVDINVNEGQTVTLVPPAGMKAASVPAPVTARSAIGSMNSLCTTLADGSVRCERSFVLPRNRWAASEQAGIRAMYDRIVEADRATVALQTVDGGSPGH